VGARLRDSDAMWNSVNERGTHRIYVTRLGPFSLVLLGLGIGLFAALVLVLAIGAFLIWIPPVALLVTATIICALLYAHCCGNRFVADIRLADGFRPAQG
jgi:hypothetical protein